MSALRPWIAAALLNAAPAVALAAYEGEFIPFPQVDVHFNDRDVPNLTQHGSEALVDFFYTASFDDWRLLSELLVSSEERDLERLTIGRVSAGGAQLWLGRNHTDLDQWNHLFHRETYLQTSIHRPGIIEFEDEGGVIPAHITGLTLEDNRDVDGQTFNYGFTAGLGPGLEQEHLVPFNILASNEGSHDLAVTAHLSDQPATGSFPDSGLFFGHTIMPSRSANIREVRQTVLGAYTNYTKNTLVVRASVFYVANDLDLTGGVKKKGSFGYAYLQPEYDLDPTWTLYGRLERTSGAEDDLFIRQVPSFINNRSLVGARYQMKNGQVLKFELATLEQYNQHFASAEIQWSAALP